MGFRDKVAFLIVTVTFIQILPRQCIPIQGNVQSLQTNKLQRVSSYFPCTKNTVSAYQVPNVAKTKDNCKNDQCLSDSICVETKKKCKSVLLSKPFATTPQPYCFREKGSFPDVEYPMYAIDIWTPNYWKCLPNVCEIKEENIPLEEKTEKSNIKPSDKSIEKAVKALLKAKSMEKENAKCMENNEKPKCSSYSIDFGPPPQKIKPLPPTSYQQTTTAPYIPIETSQLPYPTCATSEYTEPETPTSTTPMPKPEVLPDIIEQSPTPPLSPSEICEPPLSTSDDPIVIITEEESNPLKEEIISFAPEQTGSEGTDTLPITEADEASPLEDLATSDDPIETITEEEPNPLEEEIISFAPEQTGSEGTDTLPITKADEASRPEELVTSDDPIETITKEESNPLKEEIITFAPEQTGSEGTDTLPITKADETSRPEDLVTSDDPIETITKEELNPLEAEIITFAPEQTGSEGTDALPITKADEASPSEDLAPLLNGYEFATMPPSDVAFDTISENCDKDNSATKLCPGDEEFMLTNSF